MTLRSAFPAGLVALLASCSGSSGSQPSDASPAPGLTLTFASPAADSVVEVGPVVFQLAWNQPAASASPLALYVNGAPVTPLDLQLGVSQATVTLGMDGPGPALVLAVLVAASGEITSAGLPLQVEASPPPPPSPVLLFVAGPNAAGLGGSVARLGDVDGDTRDDVLVGARGSGVAGPLAGEVRAISGATGGTLWTAFGVAGDTLGKAVDGVGDLDNDGVPDAAATAPNATWTGLAKAGVVRTLSGADGSEIWSFGGEVASERLGASVAGLGDVDLDGVPDLIVGSNDAAYAGFQSGRVRVLSGADGSVLHVVDGESDNAQVGISVAGPGDVDGDGHADFFVGSWGSLDTGPSSGAATLYSGDTGLPLARFPGLAANDHLGNSVSGGGDVNLDGVPDLASGAWESDAGADLGGMALVWSGATDATLLTVLGQVPNAQFGGSVDLTADLDLDGVADLVVGAPLEAGQGAARVFSGATEDLLALERGPAGSLLGASVAAVGDLDGDGVGDWAAGAPLEDALGNDGGVLRAWSGPGVFALLPAQVGDGLALDAGPAFAGSRYALLARPVDAPPHRALVVASGELDAAGRAAVPTPPPGVVLQPLALDADGVLRTGSELRTP